MKRPIGSRQAAAFLVSLALCTPTLLHAQLTDYTQVGKNGAVNAPGGTIAKSLEEQIGAGHGNRGTPGSAVYLIKRDPARSIRRGRQLFQRKFTADQGLGPRVNNDSTGDITQQRALGAGLTDSCAACHGRPRGAAGFGGDVVTRPDSRDAPHLFGLGLVEQLADEMTRQLRRKRSRLIDRAKETGRSITRALTAKGISFGSLTASPDGGVDTSDVEGVDSDLRVRPFFAQGATISIREFIIGAFKDEMGLQAFDRILCRATDPDEPTRTTSPAGFVFDPNTDTFERPPACDVNDDPDRDNVANEIDMALVDHMEFYLLNYFKPGTYRSTARTRQGRALMDTIKCTGCHVPSLTINRDRRVADVETKYDPANGIFNDLFATATTLFKVVNDGDAFPLLLPDRASFVVENFFSDLKRHDLGPNYHEREYDGTLVTEFVTEPLWGVGTTPPYGHDGRSINLDQVIRRHGGEAQDSRDAYVALSRNRQRKIQEFLQTLILFPPDDTASNLNPGNPATANPQDPAEHGSINLGALFQISSEGPE
ncbi:MAG: thiol oxidoreductase-like protein [Gammaproteobacteria bacterium]|nr:thiol oxidoreductase-like protein [Gammaproteobacteria bacterium]